MSAGADERIDIVAESRGLRRRCGARPRGRRTDLSRRACRGRLHQGVPQSNQQTTAQQLSSCQHTVSMHIAGQCGKLTQTTDEQ